MGKKPFKTVEDLDGLRLRIDPVSGAPLKDYGAVLTTLPGPEIYTALERGMIDGVIWIWTYTFGSYKLYELSQYATLGIDLKVTDMYTFVNKDAWNKLPDEWKKLANFSASKATERYDNYLAKADVGWLPKFMGTGMEITQFPAEERAKLVEKAESAYQAWIKDKEDKGLPGKEVFEWAKAKREEIIAKYTEKK